MIDTNLVKEEEISFIDSESGVCVCVCVLNLDERLGEGLKNRPVGRK